MPSQRDTWNSGSSEGIDNTNAAEMIRAMNDQASLSSADTQFTSTWAQPARAITPVASSSRVVSSDGRPPLISIEEAQARDRARRQAYESAQSTTHTHANSSRDKAPLLSIEEAQARDRQRRQAYAAQHQMLPTISETEDPEANVQPADRPHRAVSLARNASKKIQHGVKAFHNSTMTRTIEPGHKRHSSEPSQPPRPFQRLQSPPTSPTSPKEKQKLPAWQPHDSTEPMSKTEFATRWLKDELAYSAGGGRHFMFNYVTGNLHRDDFTRCHRHSHYLQANREKDPYSQAYNGPPIEAPVSKPAPKPFDPSEKQPTKIVGSASRETVFGDFIRAANGSFESAAVVSESRRAAESSSSSAAPGQRTGDRAGSGDVRPSREIQSEPRRVAKPKRWWEFEEESESSGSSSREGGRL